MLVILYLALGYWAVGKTVYQNQILVSNKIGGIFFQKLAMAFVLGWILIPIAIIKLIISLLK